MTYKQKQNLIRVLVIVAAVLLVFSVVRLFTGGNKDNNYSKTRTTWAVGTIDDTGTFDESEKDSMVSKRIEIGHGFKIVPDFNKSVSYQVYYYDEKDNFLGMQGSTPISNILEMSAEDVAELLEIEGEETVEAKYFRVVMTPNDNDGQIKFREKLIYRNHISITSLKTAKK